MADASPFMGRDWFLMAYEVFKISHLYELFEYMKRILEGHDLEGVDPPDNISNTFWEGRRFYHTAIPTALGSKAASVPH